MSRVMGEFGGWGRGCRGFGGLCWVGGAEEVMRGYRVMGYPLRARGFGEGS